MVTPGPTLTQRSVIHAAFGLSLALPMQWRCHRSASAYHRFVALKVSHAEAMDRRLSQASRMQAIAGFFATLSCGDGILSDYGCSDMQPSMRRWLLLATLQLLSFPVNDSLGIFALERLQLHAPELPVSFLLDLLTEPDFYQKLRYARVKYGLTRVPEHFIAAVADNDRLRIAVVNSVDVFFDSFVGRYLRRVSPLNFCAVVPSEFLLLVQEMLLKQDVYQPAVCQAFRASLLSIPVSLVAAIRSNLGILHATDAVPAQIHSFLSEMSRAGVYWPRHDRLVSKLDLVLRIHHLATMPPTRRSWLPQFSHQSLRFYSSMFSYIMGEFSSAPLVGLLSSVAMTMFIPAAAADVLAELRVKTSLAAHIVALLNRWTIVNSLWFIGGRRIVGAVLRLAGTVKRGLSAIVPVSLFGRRQRSPMLTTEGTSASSEAGSGRGAAERATATPNKQNLSHAAMEEATASWIAGHCSTAIGTLHVAQSMHLLVTAGHAKAAFVLLMALLCAPLLIDFSLFSVFQSFCFLRTIVPTTVTTL